MDRIMRHAPHHCYSIFLSGQLSEPASAPEELRQLAATDRRLCDEFLRDENTSPHLSSAPDLPAPNRGDGLARLRATEPDLIVSIRYRRILEDAAIAIPRHGVLNLHSAILPNYRGVMTTFWAMLAEETEIGSTLHRIVDSGIDTGPILKISRQTRRPDRSYLANVLSLYDSGCEAILSAVESIAKGSELESEQQTRGPGAYFSAPKQADLDSFRAKGLLLASGNELRQLQMGRE